MMTIDSLKKQATILKDFLKVQDSAINHSLCLEATARMHGYKNWNTASALLKKTEEPLKIPTQKLSFRDKPVYVAESVFLFKYNTGGTSDQNHNHDARELLDVILHNLKENSLIIQSISPRSFLWDKWTKERLAAALESLQGHSYINYTFDEKQTLIISINPYLFWKGKVALHQKAVDTLNLSLHLSSKILPFERSIHADVNSIIVFSEKNEKWRNQAITLWKTGEKYDETKHEELLNELLKNIAYSYMDEWHFERNTVDF